MRSIAGAQRLRKMLPMTHRTAKTRIHHGALESRKVASRSQEAAARYASALPCGETQLRRWPMSGTPCVVMIRHAGHLNLGSVKHQIILEEVADVEVGADPREAQLIQI